MAEKRHSSGAPLWGVAAEFDNAGAALAAVQHLRGRDFGRIDAFTPAPVPGLADTLRLPRRNLYGTAAGAALAGGLAMFGMCTYATVYDYRFNIGGRPVFSWPSFIVPSVSFGMLAGALALVLVTMALSRLPRLNHPAFNIPNFVRVSEDRYFVAVEARDATFAPDLVEAVFAALPERPLRISRVPR